MRGRFEKDFHVSPFMGMDHTYAWRMTEPGERLIVHIESERDERIVFDATLSLSRRELTPARLRFLLARHPLLTLRIVVRIYAQRAAAGAAGRTLLPEPERGAAAAPRTSRAHPRLA